MKRLRIQFFNIVEVALALAIVGIGIAGIMSLFPVALNASRDSVGDNNAPDVAEQFLAFLEAKVQANPSIDWSSHTLLSAITTAKPGATEKSWKTTPITGTNLYSNVDNDSDIFKIEQKSGTIIDFSAVIRIWKQQIPDIYLEIPSTTDKNHLLSEKFGIALYIEVSWPAEKPYPSREKRIYYQELLNPYALP